MADHPARDAADRLAPLLRLHLFLRNLHFIEDQMLRSLDEFVRATRVEDSVGGVVDVFLNKLGVNAPTPSGPRVFRMQPRASHVKIEILVLLLQFLKFVVEDNVVRGPNAVENRNLCIELPPRRFTDKTAKRRHAAAASNADEMFVGLINRKESARRRDHEKFVAFLHPIDYARAHLAVALNSHLVNAAIQCARGERIRTFVTRRVGKIERYELPRFKIDVVTLRPFETHRLRVRQFHFDRLNRHFNDLFGHDRLALA